MSPAKPVRLAVNLHASGRHDAAWKTLPHPASLPTNIDEFVRIAHIAEAGGFDALFLADSPGGLTEEAWTRPWRALDPIALLSALSQATRHIGLVATASSILGHPAVVARQVASLDHISKGRAAWNIITSQNEHSLGAFGIPGRFEQAERYGRAEELVAAVVDLWDSLPADAVAADTRAGIYVDRARTRPVERRGRHFSARGVLGVPAGPQGRPVLFQAGTSEESKKLGARWADALFTGQRTIESARGFYADVKSKARAFGRDPAKLLVLPGLFPILGSTEAEARRRKDELDSRLDLGRALEDLAQRLGIEPDDLTLDGPLPYALVESAPLDDSLARRHREQLLAEARQKGLTTRQVVYNNITGGHRVTLGTPEQIADDILSWIDGDAADGFTLNIDVQPQGLETFIDTVIPELRRRGRFRHDYADGTFRETLGIA